MYSNINVVRCVSIILNKIYADPEKYLNFKGTDGKLLPPPKRELFKVFLIKTLQKFSIVETGSALSPMLSNIFVHALETKIVQKKDIKIHFENRLII
jgi:hypothetical protein